MQNNNNDKLDIGYLATASWTVDSSGIMKRTDCVNTQLDAWIDAKSKYYDLLNRDYNWGDFKLIISKLGDSLTDLFGINYNDNSNYTPPLLAYINKIFPNEFGWNLEKDNPQLYLDFLKLDNFHKDKCKHYDINKVPELEKLHLDDLKRFMETTRQVWLWFFNKKFGRIIPVELLKEFGEKYI